MPIGFLIIVIIIIIITIIAIISTGSRPTKKFTMLYNHKNYFIINTFFSRKKSTLDGEQ
jgi:hypothetical protein